MNIRESLLEPPVLLKPEATKIAEYAASSKKNFDKLMQCFLQDEFRLQQRSAHCISMAAQKNGRLVEPYIPVLIRQLSRKGASDAVLRNSLRILQNAKIPEKYFGETMNACYAFLENGATPVAIKVFALTVLANMAQTIPEIKSDIKLLIDFQMENATAGFKARARRVLRRINFSQ